MHLPVVLALVTLLLAYSTRGNATSIVYEQVGRTLPWVCPCAVSDTSNGEDGWQTFDNFTLEETHLVTQVVWHGAYIHWNDDKNPGAADTISWEITLWGESGLNQPSDLLYSESQFAADVDSTFLGYGVFGGSTLVNPIPIYEFVFTLSTPFVAEAGSEYWVSWLSTSPTVFDPWFGSAFSWDGDGQSLQERLATGGSNRLSWDLAFALRGASVPAPPTLTIFCLGLAALGWSRRKRA